MLEILAPDDIDFSHYLAETDPGEKVRPAIEYLDEVMHVLSPIEETPEHPKMPFANFWLYFAPAEVTIWGGFNGSGKSMLQGQVLADFAEQGKNVCIASFEMKPAKTIARITRQIFGHRTPTKEQVAAFLGRNNGRLWLYDQQGTVRPERMIAVIKHCAEKLGCQHIAIDSLMKCVRGTDDYNAQKDFVDQLTAAARDYNTHIHLVAHLKKGDSDDRMPTRLDISGTGAISDLVDNVLLVWRNKKKERNRDAGEAVNDADPDSVLICDKSRNGEWEGRIKLWYDRSSLKFTDYPRRSGMLDK
ncbi:MAG: AAA family ATPase [Burkholderiaceae bacterium]|nr:AAA family ATPase [Burkholderiaceae bacterium]